MQLEELGFDQWFAARVAELDGGGCAPARVCSVDRGVWRIRDEAGEAVAEASGKLLYTAESSNDIPCVGDWVLARRHDAAQAVIHHLLPRRSHLRRKTPGGTSHSQMIAANVDVALIIQSCVYDFSPARLERALVLATEGGVEPLVLLAKTDLAVPGQLERQRAVIENIAPGRVLPISCVTGHGLQELRTMLLPGRTCCLLGSSGVGKSTLINRLMGGELLKTGAVSETGEGTHTTTRRQLMRLAHGALLIDTPGMRELGMVDAEGGVEGGFEDITRLTAQCRFVDCSHGGEPGCAVQASLERGDLSAARFANYLKLRKEIQFAELSAQGRRERDKAFGRMVRAVKRSMRK